MRPRIPLHGPQGRLRKHITMLGRHYAVGHWPPERESRSIPDQFLKDRLEAGDLTMEELQALLSEHQRNAGAYEGIARFSDRLLDKADDVFWAKYGRNPREQEWSTRYTDICRNLDGDLHYYDGVLESYVQRFRESDGVAAAGRRQGARGAAHSRWVEMKGLERFLVFLLCLASLGLAAFCASLSHETSAGAMGALLFGVGGLLLLLMSLVGKKPRG